VKELIKKIFLISAALIFASVVLTTSVIKTSAQSLAQNYQVEPISVTAVEGEGNEKETGLPAAQESIEYQLPYPGILPDHFLYPLKMIRDRIWLFLTTDSLKKAELLLTYADKRLWAAQLLLDKGQEEKAVATASKAEKYLEQAVAQEVKAREGGKKTESFLARLSQASLKHEEMLLGIKERVSDQAKGVIEGMLGYPRQAYEQVKRVSGRAEVKVALTLEFNEDKIETYGDVSLEQPATAFGVLEKVAEDHQMELVTKKYDFGILVESIDGVKNTKDRAWIYFVNGQAGEVASDKLELADGDMVEWRYIEPGY
jgi:hypothetical protein